MKQEQLGFLIPMLKDILLSGSRQLWKFLHLEWLNDVKSSKMNIHVCKRITQVLKAAQLCQSMAEPK